jgi:hypothetical protein
MYLQTAGWKAQNTKFFTLFNIKQLQQQLELIYKTFYIKP